MALNITIKEVSDKIIIGLVGNLDTNTSPEAEDEINKYLEKGVTKILIDLEHTRYVSSAGLRIFLATAKKTIANSGMVMLCHPNKIVKEILDVSGFSTIIVVKPTVDDALKEM